MMMMTSLWKVMMTDVSGSWDTARLLHQLSRGSGRLRVTDMRSLTCWLKACFLQPEEILFLVCSSGLRILAEDRKK